MTTPDLPPLRYLSAADVIAAMPAARGAAAPRRADDGRARRRTPSCRRRSASIRGPMARSPTRCRRICAARPRTPTTCSGSNGSRAFPANSARGLPAIHGPGGPERPATGVPIAILDAGPITAQRTAAISGVAIRTFAPTWPTGPCASRCSARASRRRSHLPVLGHVLPGLELTVFDRHPERADAARGAGRARPPGIARPRPSRRRARDATLGADVVVTAASFAPAEQRQTMTDGLARARTPSSSPVDYATYVAAVGRPGRRALFLVDQREQFLANRDAGQLRRLPRPGGDDRRGDPRRRASDRPHGRVVVSHLGVGLADLVFADAILRRATERDLGTDPARAEGDGAARGQSHWRGLRFRRPSAAEESRGTPPDRAAASRVGSWIALLRRRPCRDRRARRVADGSRSPDNDRARSRSRGSNDR